MRSAGVKGAKFLGYGIGTRTVLPAVEGSLQAADTSLPPERIQ